MPFLPAPGDTLLIDGVSYRVAERPGASGQVYAQEGRQGAVFQLTAYDRPPMALKAFLPRFRDPGLVRQAEWLASFTEIPGLQVCRRSVLSPRRHADLLHQHPDLSYAVIMPWVTGPRWQDLLRERRPLSADQSLALARALADLLTGLEEQGLAHGDLAGSNLLLPGLADAAADYPLALVDVEGMCGPGLEPPEALPSGSAGYGHRAAAAGGRNSDRFAGALLLAELLGWCDEQVRAAAAKEYYFDPEELQQPGTRYDTLRAALGRRWGDGVAQLLDRAWCSETLADCPSIGEWLLALPSGKGERLATLPPARAAAARLPARPPAEPFYLEPWLSRLKLWQVIGGGALIVLLVGAVLIFSALQDGGLGRHPPATATEPMPSPAARTATVRPHAATVTTSAHAATATTSAHAAPPTSATISIPTEPFGPAVTTGSGLPLAIGSDGDILAFDKPTLEAVAGKLYTLTFTNNSTAVQHSWVLVNGDETLATSAAQAATTAMARARNPMASVPPADTPGLLAALPIINPGQTGLVTFTAPGPGSYIFICTFPGHYIGGSYGGMFGTLEVTTAP
jgi:uncharacterized cupredoxin-like copper-binding protein